MLTWMKKQIVISSMKKRKKDNPFDIEYADNYELDSSATSDVNNSHYFSVHSFETKECLYYRSAKRGGDGSDEVWLVYRDLNGDVYMGEADHYKRCEKNPTSVKCIEAGKKIEFSYDGFVRKAVLTGKGYVPDNTLASIPFKLNGLFTGNSSIFEFTNHMDPGVTAGAIAKEKLSKEFKEAFNSIYQVHYEQGGTTCLEINLGDKKNILINYPTIRDHSYGRRNWDFFDRYIWTIILLENGEILHTSFMRYPVLHELQAGFSIHGDKMTGVKKATEMDNIPITGSTPKEFKIDVEYVNGTKKHIEAKLDFVCPFYFENDFNVNEGVCEFYVDGIRGRGIGEFAFNKDKNRWVR